ncbi:S-layer homology domain-containing protein [Cohnella sp. GbtcB17]|uniref:S-layer homology domain-containing protein n=1 Tax=Cohnella sp. GbtcB17 TaxID=2824762 RepID=UPI001C308B50|nr:S-layer homology domain-containing protein [Cohnella sp. GbtcB17]
MHPLSARQIRKSSLSVFLAMCMLLSTVMANTAAPGRANAEGPDPAQRVPVNPYPSPVVDSALAKHDLTAAPSPLDNPLKGFAPFYPWDNEASLPHSLEWFYVPLKAVMNGPNSFTFDSGIEPQLNAIAARGNQAVLRVYLEYPGEADAIPQFMHDDGIAIRHNDAFNQDEPDYDDPRMVTYLTNFIQAFGAKYDGDPRIGFIHMGLVGLWGEWHTWPYDTDTSSDSYPDHMPNATTINAIFNAYDTAFNHTKLEVRNPGLPNAGDYNFGYHDDSFGFKEGDPLQSVTQPESMGGAYYSFMTQMLDAGSENKWITESIGGEVRPEIQERFFSGGADVDDAIDDIELTHATWMINHKGVGSYSANDAAVAAGIRKMGYDLNVKSAYYNNVAQGDPLKVGVTIQNNGVAPFSYPWKVQLGVKNASGKLVKQWDTTWDITKVQPAQIRTYPEWNVPGNPKYVPFGEPYYFDTTIADPALSDGYYYLVMKVVNPLEAISSKAKRVGFANADQDKEGWLNLGTLLMGDCASPCTPPPTTPPPPPTKLLVDNYDGTPAWSGSTQNDLNQWTGSSNFANGNGAGVVEDGALILQYQNMSRLETNIGRNLTATSKLVIRAKGAVGGEESQINITIGGVTKTLGQFSGDTLTTSFKDLVIDLPANGVDLSQTIWSIALSQATWNTTGTIYIDEIYFTDKYESDTETGGGNGNGPDTPTNPGAGSPGLIEDFESYGSDEAVKQAWTEAWSDKPGSVTRALSQASGSKGLRLSVATADSEWANIIHAIPEGKRDWSRYDGLSFWLNNTTSDSKDFSLNVALETPVTKGEFGLKDGGSALTLAADGSWRAAAFNGASLNVPAGFSGVVRIPWDQFVQAAWQCDGDQSACAAALDPSEIDGLQFGFPPKGYIHNVITIDDIALYRADRVLDSFDTYADDAALQNVWKIDWEDGNPSALRTIDKTNVADGTQAMKLSVVPPSGKPASNWVNIKRAAFTGTDTDWTDYDGLTFWVNNASPSGKSMDLNVALVTDASKGEFSLKAGGAVKFYNAVDGWKTTTLGGGSLSIAAGYKGMVRIPWGAFSQSSWQGCGACDAAFDRSKVLQIQFGFGPANQSDNVLTIDALGLYALAGRTGGGNGGPSGPEPVDHPSAPAWATAAGTHALTYSQAPVDNPLKGFLPFYDASEEAYFTAGDDWRDRPTQLPYSMEFFYLPLSKLMNNLNDFDWTELDKRLEAVAARGNQAVFRVYLDYPNKPSGIPQFLIDEGLKTFAYEGYDNGKDATSLAPDYNDERLMAALDNFIGALGARYDGDPRIGFIMIGLIGFWGEWHTYPYDGNLKSPNLMPTDANLKRVLTDMDHAFDDTKLVLRYPMDNNTLKTTNFDVGYHDDSFAFQTLPPSLGGQSWHFWGRIKDASATEFWKTNSMGGEMRPEIQVKMWNNDPPRYNEPATPIEGAQGEDYYTSLNLTHASWLIAQGIFQTPLGQEPLARATEGSRKMGYEYDVPTAYLDATGGNLKVGVEVENKGVAPFYYNWKVELAAQTDTGIVKIWEPGWDLKDILPNTNGFDGNKLFASTSNPALGNGSYQILMRYVNPLEQINADAKPFRFANAEQNEGGWLNLGSVVVSGSAAEAPARVTGITSDTAEQLRLAPGKSVQISVAAAPAAASNTRVVWSSADPAVAYVSAAGLVKGVGVGQTVITAKTSDGGFAKQFRVTVSSESEPETNPPSGGTNVTPATPAPEQTKDGVKLGQDAVKTTQTKNADGVAETTATIDAKRLKEAFDALRKQASTTFNTITIDVKNDGGSVKVNVPSSALIDVASHLPGAFILVKTDIGTYKVPVRILDLAATAKKLGAGPEGMTIRIEINKVAGAAAAQLSEQAAKAGLTLLASSLAYDIYAEANGKSVEVADFGSTYVERTMILSEAVDPSKTTALLYDPAAGTFRFVPAVFQASGDRTEAVIKRNGNSIYAVAIGSKTFADLIGHWAKADIESLASKRIVNGVAPSRFSPSSPITRAEFAALLVRSLGLSAPNASASFSDVVAADWYSDAVEQVAHAGLVEGYQDGSFKPDDRITREQMAVMLSRALAYAGSSADVKEANDTILAPYSDGEFVDAWARPAVAQMLDAGVIRGKSETELDPDAEAGRAEAVVMIRRFLQLIRFMN